MECPKCQFDNREEAAFCRKCGAPLVEEIICKDCGFVNPPDSLFCEKCGHDLSAPKEAPKIDLDQPQSYTPKFLADKILTNRSVIEGERKQVTVLFSDVANYTSISESLDPEEVHQIMDECFKILMEEIHSVEGTINQFTGDGIMALFGAPVAHEDHAQRACYAALSIQRAIAEYGEKVRNDTGAEFKMRLGLNSGLVIVGSIGDDLRMDYTAVGDTTNLASRMESIASPGTIVVSKNTYRAAKDFFEFKSIGKVEIKGKREPQESYELIKASEVGTRIEASIAKGLTKFVGRKREIDTLKEAYSKARSGSGQIVGIVGEAGVGKSRLLLELRHTLPVGETIYLEGRCLHFGGSIPYLPILDILRSYFEIKEEDREFVIKKKMEDKTQQLDERLKSALPSFQELLSLKVDDGAYLQIEPQQKRERCFEAIRDLFIRESERQPIVLVVEDLHWIDRTSGDFLGYLIDWLANIRILLILLYRPEYTHGWGSKSYYSKIGVDQLSTKSSVILVQNILEGGEVVPELRDLIINRAGGNPLFVEELTHSLLENGSIERKDHQYVLIRKASEIEVPDTIQGIIAARLDRVEENLKRIMQVASVIGREFAYRVLQTIMGMREELKSSLINLQGLEFIYEKRLFPELEYIFKHAMTQEVAYNSLLHKRRKEIHEKIGNAIEELYPDRLEEYYELLAYHYVRCDNKQKAVEYLKLANQKAIKVSAMEDALAYFEEVMNLLDTLPDNPVNREQRISILVHQGNTFMMLFKTQTYYELLTHYEPIAIELKNQWLLGALYNGKAWCEWWFGYFDQSIKTSTKAAELCEAEGNAEMAGGAYMMLQWDYVCKGDFEKSIAFKEDVLRMMEQLFNLRVCVYSYCAAVWAHTFLGRWDEAIAEGQAALDVAEEYSDSGLISFAAASISMVYASKGDLEQAIKYGELGVEKAPTPAEKFWAQGFLAWAWCLSGDTHRGIESMTNVIAAQRFGSFKFGEVGYLGLVSIGYIGAGEYEKAHQTLKEGLELAEDCGLKWWIGQQHCLLGEVYLKMNPTQEEEPLAAPHFEQSVAISQQIKAENTLALSYFGFGRLYKQKGDIPLAREYLTKALKIFEQLGTLIEPDNVREELAELPIG
jgi:class 3 adenylate cyclase/tetratricopeptide (TPR) repeat protein/ribosomal protein L40E